jgi:iron(III) transport system permease protein
VTAAPAGIIRSGPGLVRAGHRPPIGLLAAGIAVSLLVLLPIAVTIVQAAQAGGRAAAALLVRPLVGELLLNTVGLMAVTALLSAVIGVGAAWCVERTMLPGRRAWGTLAVVPLAIPAFVTSYAWVSLSPNLQDFAGAVLVFTAAYYPLVYLPIAATLRGLDPVLEETARGLGYGPWKCFVRLVLPQLRPALYGGMLLVALHGLTEFGAFALLRFRTFTTEIYTQYRVGFNGPGASVLSGVLMLLCLALLFVELKVRGTASYGRIGPGTKRAPTLYDLGASSIVVLGAFAALVAVTIGVPIGMILYWLAHRGVAAVSPAEVSAGLLIHSAAASVGFGAAAAVLTTLLALPLGFLATRYRGPAVTLLERTAYLPQGLPGIVIALALVSLAIHAARGLYQTAALLIVAYAILFLPLALVSVRSALLQAQIGLEETARSLGLGWGETLRRVVLPLAAPGLGAAAALVFISVVGELTATLLLVPIGTETLATQVWADTSTLAFAAAAPYAALMLAISLGSSWLLTRRAGWLRMPDRA